VGVLPSPCGLRQTGRFPPLGTNQINNLPQSIPASAEAKKRPTYRELTVFSESCGQKRSEMSPIIGNPNSSIIQYFEYFAGNNRGHLHDVFADAQDKNSWAVDWKYRRN